MQSMFAKAIHDKQLLVLIISGLFGVADIAFGLHFTAAQLEAGAGIVASYLLGSSYLAAKHAQGEHSVAAAEKEAAGSHSLVEHVMGALGRIVGESQAKPGTSVAPTDTPKSEG